MTLHIETPLVASSKLSAPSGRPIWLKLDMLQPSGSFKIRGVGLACQTYLKRGARRFVASSGGNAGLAVAYAGRMLSVPVTVVVPETTSQRARDLLRCDGAEVIVHGPSWHEANGYAQSLLEERDAFIHPFDDPLLWEGHASMIDEVFRAGLKPDAVVLSVGGGGLLAGVSEGLDRNGAYDVPIIAVETAGAPAFREAIRCGRPVQLTELKTFASSLAVKRVCNRAVDWSRDRPIRSVLVSDKSALAACERFLDDHRLLVEPACGASLAVVYDQPEAIEGFTNVLVIVCGGVTATIDQIRQWSALCA